MYIPSNHVNANDNDRIVFDTDIMEYIDAFRLFDDVFDYRFMYEYNERNRNDMVTSFHHRLLSDARWKDMIRELNSTFVDMFARIVIYNGHNHIVVNDRIVTLYGEDEIHVGYDGAVHEFISYLKNTDIAKMSGIDIVDAHSCVRAINKFVKIVRAMNANDNS